MSAFPRPSQRVRHATLLPTLLLLAAPLALAQTVAARPTSASESSPASSDVWANYDFVPGSRPLYVNDFSSDVVGDFPARLRWGQGTFEIVETQGTRFLRATSAGWFAIMLPERLPERFTVELMMSASGGWNQEIFFGPPSRGVLQPRVLISQNRSGVAIGNEQTLSAPARSYRGAVFPIRVMVDGAHAKVFMGETRVANIPTIDFGREREIRFQVRAQQGAPVLISDLRVMAGGKELYDAIAADGRVSTQGIFFATASDVVKPESRPTLEQIARMLTTHPDLRLTIEGHTDDVGEARANASLSERRAAAVRAALGSGFGVDVSRLTAQGLGATRPARPNTSPEGRQANRRVELVKE